MMTRSEHASDIERLVVLMAREVKNDDVAVVGIGTPVALAALLLARSTNAPNVSIMMPGALDPAPDDVAQYLSDPTRAMIGASARLSRLKILDAIRSGSVSLQFVRPAQIDGRFRINTEFLHRPSGDVYLVGPVALPEVVHLVGRVIAYLPKHHTTTLVSEVDWVTAPRLLDGRTIAKVVTPIAILERLHSGPSFVGITSQFDERAVRELTGFELSEMAAAQIDEPSEAELETLRRVVDPLGLIGMEDPSASQVAIQKLANLWHVPSKEEVINDVEKK
jgi:glutaconate CoA-transferase subunit B